MARPNPLAHITKGEVLYNVTNFVATFNWMVDYISNLKAGDGIEIENVDGNHPVIKSEAREIISGDDSNVVIKDKGDGTMTIDVYYTD